MSPSLLFHCCKTFASSTTNKSTLLCLKKKKISDNEHFSAYKTDSLPLSQSKGLLILGNDLRVFQP